MAEKSKVSECRELEIRGRHGLKEKIWRKRLRDVLRIIEYTHSEFVWRKLIVVISSVTGY